MVNASFPLRDEHRLILRVLDGLDLALERWGEAGAASPGQGAAFVEFLREFADGCHHRKEEELLFPVLASLHFDAGGSPVAQLLGEHLRLRTLTREFSAQIAGAEAGDSAALASLRAAGRELAATLRRHVDKEEHCLFGMADAVILGKDLEHLLAAYQALEATPEFDAPYTRGRQLAARLVADLGVPAARPARASRPTGRATVAAHAVASTDERAVASAVWQHYRTPLSPDPGTELASQCARALASDPIGLIRQALERIGRRLSPEPMLWKLLPGGFLRLFFPVLGQPDHLESSTVVAVVLLHELASERTLYAHPVFAGPEANPLLKHLGGPMAQPRAQAGENGVTATRRLLYHKISIWDAYERERPLLGFEEATRRWRARYGWSLVRLYFCERCSACRWGSPFLEGDGGAPFQYEKGHAPPMHAKRRGEWADTVAAIRASKAWRIESAYARRGAFELGEQPRLVARVNGDWTLALFPTDVEILDGGSIVAAAAYYHEPSRETRWVQCLAAGEEAETLFMSGDDALGLPQPGGRHGRGPRRYAEWRRHAWSRFWLDELEIGVHAASQRWLASYWDALRKLLRASG